VVVVGLVHGLTGAAALLLILPAAVSGSRADQVLYLGGFSIGSTLAMAGLTASIASFSLKRRFSAVVSTRVPKLASGLSILLGSAWMVGSL
jgi:hypothetical protein